MCNLKERGVHMLNNIDLTMLYRIAKYYYEDHLSQNEIAQREHVSRPHVSKLLDKAREYGIVEIVVALPEKFQISETEKKLQERLGLYDAIVVISPSETKQINKKISMNIATAAVQNIPSWIEGCRNVGIGWGYTMYQTSLQLSYSGNHENLTFVPLIGISGEDNPFFQINAIVDRFAEKFGANSYYINIPAMRENTIELSQIEKERNSKLLRYWDSLDAVIVGLGVPLKSGEFLITEVSREYKEVIKNSDTLGDILYQFFYSDGTVFDFKSNYEQVSFPIYKLRDIKKVICLAGGAAKVDGIIAAARNGFINTLVTDSTTARMILERL